MEEEKIFKKLWQLATSEQRARYNNLMSSYPTIKWTYKEKKYLLALRHLVLVEKDTTENLVITS